MISPKYYEEYIRFQSGVQAWLIDNLEGHDAVFINPVSRTVYDPDKDMDKGLLCGEFKRPYFSIIDTSTGDEVATVEFVGYDTAISVNSKTEQFDEHAQKFLQRFGKDCHFKNDFLLRLFPSTKSGA